MANTIQIKRRTDTSDTSALSALSVGELGVDLTDSNKLYVGTSGGNQLLNPSSSGTLTSTGDFTIDSGDGIILDADGGAISLKDDGTRFGILEKATNDLVISNPIDDANILFKYKDGGTVKTALTLNGSGNFAAFPSGLIVTGTLSALGNVNLSADLSLNDSGKIKLGVGDDLEIYHDGSHSYIKDTGTGNLVLNGNQIWLKNAANSANMIGCVEGSYVKLFHNNNERFVTTSTGAAVTGNLTVGSGPEQGNAHLFVRRNGDAINFGHNNQAGYGSVIGCSSHNGQPHIGFMCEAGTNNNTFRTRGLKGNVIYTNTSGTLYFAQVTNANADNQSLTNRAYIDSSGHATFSNNLTVSGSVYLNDTNTRIVEGGSNSVRLQTNSGYVDVGPHNASYSHFQTDRSRFYFNKELIVDTGIIRSYNEDLQLDASFNGAVVKNIRFRTGNVEKIRMDTDGALLINTTSKGSSSGRLYAGSPYVTSSAIAQFNGFLRFGFGITHDATRGIYPQVTGQGSIGMDSQRYGKGFFQRLDIGVANDGEGTSFGDLVVMQQGDTNADGFAVVGTTGNPSLRLWTDVNGNRKINAGGTEVISFTTSAISLLHPVSIGQSAAPSGNNKLEVYNTSGNYNAVFKNSGQATIEVKGGEASSARIRLIADEGDDVNNADHFQLIHETSNNFELQRYNTTSGWVWKWKLDSSDNVHQTGNLTVGGDLDLGGNLIVGEGGNNKSIKVRHIDGKDYDSDDFSGLFLNNSNQQPVYVGNPSNNADFYVRGAADVTGNLTVGGNTTLGDAGTDTTTVSGSLVCGDTPYPASGSISLGYSSNRWSTIYGAAGDFSGNLTVGGTATVQPSAGDGILTLKNSAASQILRLDQNSIRTTTNNHLTLFTNGNSNQLYLSSDGAVGIGTGSPASGKKLHVAGQVQADSSFIINNTAFAGKFAGVGTGPLPAFLGGSPLFHWTTYNSAGSATLSNFAIMVDDGGDVSFGNTTSSTLPRSLYLDTSGNLGVGASPSAKLHIRSTGLSDNSRNSLLLLEGQFTASGVDSGDEVGIAFGVENSGGGNQQTICITSSYQPSYNSLNLQPAGGNVGIATVNPSEKLHVAGNVRASQYHTTTGNNRTKLRFWGNTSHYGVGMHSEMTFGGLSDYALTFQFNNDSDRGFWWGDSTHTNAQGAMALTTEGKLTVAHSMRLGFGESDTTTPGSTATLHIKGDARVESNGSDADGALINLRHANNNTTDVVSTLMFSNSAGSVAKIVGETVGGNTNGVISFYTDNAGTSTEAMRIDSSQRVGIGTASPSYKVHIVESSNATTGLKIDNTNTGTSARNGVVLLNDSGSNAAIYLPSTNYTGVSGWANHLVFSTDSNISGGILMRPATGGLQVSTSGVNNNDFVVTAAGRCGIGAANPTNTLEVKGPNTVAPFKIVNSSNSDRRFLQISSSSNYPRLTLYNNSEASTVHLDTNGSSYINGGSLGIGTTSPNGKLTIHTATNSNGLLIYEDTNDSLTHNLYIDGSDQGVLDLRNASNAVKVQLHTGGHSYFTGGSLGVGTAAPAKLLTVQSTTSPIVGLYSTYSDSNARNWSIATNNAAYGDFTISNSSANGGNPNAIKLTILKEGSVGIGTSAPAAKLHVANGDVLIKNDAAGATDHSELNIFKSSGHDSSSAILRVGYDASSSYMIHRQRASGSIIVDSQQSSSQVYHQINGSTKLLIHGSGTDVTGVSRSTSYRTEHTFEWSGRTAAFANGTSGLVSKLNFGNEQIWGWIEVTLTDAYNYAPSTGKLTRLYEIGHNQSTAYNYANGKVTESYGEVKDEWKLGDLELVNSNVTIPIIHRTTAGNQVAVHVRGMIHGSNATNILNNLSLSSPALESYNTDIQYAEIADMAMSGTNGRLRNSDGEQIIGSDGTLIRIPSITVNGIAAGTNGLYVKDKTSYLKGNVGINVAPDAIGSSNENALKVTGTSYFSGAVEFDGGIKDKDGNLGTDGQLLKSTGSDVDWVTLGWEDLPNVSSLDALP